MKKILILLVLLTFGLSTIWAEVQKVTVLSIEKNAIDRNADYVINAMMRRDFKKLFSEYEELELIDIKKSSKIVKNSGYENISYIGKENIMELGNKLGADIVIWGEICTIENSEFKLTMSILDMNSGELTSNTFNVKKDSKSRLATLKEKLIIKIQEFSGGQVEKLMSIAIQQFNSKNFSSAKESFENVNEVDSENWAANFYLGFINSSRDYQDFETAIEYFDRAYELNPENTEILNQTSKTYMRMGDSDNAVLALEKITEVEPEKKEIWLRIGDIYAENESTDDAQAAFEKALEIDETYLEANEALGFLLYEQEYYEEAIPYLENASDAKPESDSIQKKLAKSYHKAGRLDAAIQKYESVVQENPENTSAYFNLAGAYRITDNNDKALDALLKVKELEPDNAGVYLRLGDVYLVLREYGKAEYNANKAITMDPENYEGNYLVAQIFQAKGYVKYEEFLKHEEEYADKSKYYGSLADEKVELRDKARNAANYNFKAAKNLLNEATQKAETSSEKKDIKDSLDTINQLIDATKASNL